VTAPLWQPSAERIRRAHVTSFLRVLAEEHGVELPDPQALYRWSIQEPERFWRSVWSFGGIRGEPGEVTLRHGDRMPGARWFPEAKLNFAENLC